MAPEYPERVKAIDWAALESAYGSARDVGQWLIDLRSPDWDTASHASHMLWCSLCHQHVFISPAAVVALPFLLEVGKSADERLLVELLDIFCGFALCSASPDGGRPPGAWVAHVRVGLLRELEWFRCLRTLSNEDVAGFARAIVESLSSPR
jgi:hypothetical protein